MLESSMSQEIKALRDHVETRFKGLEGWLERVSMALDRQSNDRERLIKVETRFEALQDRLSSHERQTTVKISALSDKTTEDRERVIKMGVYFAIATAVVTAVAPVIIKKLFGA